MVLSRSRHSKALSRSWHWSILKGWSWHWSGLGCAYMEQALEGALEEQSQQTAFEELALERTQGLEPKLEQTGLRLHGAGTGRRSRGAGTAKRFRGAGTGASRDWRAWLRIELWAGVSRSRRAWASDGPRTWLRSGQRSWLWNGQRTRRRAGSGSGPDTPQTPQDTFPPT